MRRSQSGSAVDALKFQVAIGKNEEEWESRLRYFYILIIDDHIIFWTPLKPIFQREWEGILETFKLFDQPSESVVLGVTLDLSFWSEKRMIIKTHAGAANIETVPTNRPSNHPTFWFRYMINARPARRMDLGLTQSSTISWKWTEPGAIQRRVVRI